MELQEQIDLITNLPVFGQVENIEKNTEKISEELKTLNEYLIERDEETKKMEILSLEPVEELEVLEVVEEEEQEIQIDYDSLIFEQLETLNAHMEQSNELQEENNIISSETAILMVATITIAIGIKVLVEQITKW